MIQEFLTVGSQNGYCYEGNFRPQNVWNLTNTSIPIQLHLKKKLGDP